MYAGNHRLPLKAAAGLTNLTVVLGVALFGAAGTLRFVEGWVFLGIFTFASLAITIDLARHDPALLARRTQAGPVAERTRSQKIIQGFASLAFLTILVVPGLDRRYGWSRAPLGVVALGDALVLIGFWIVSRVFRENKFTSAVIEVMAEQRVIDSGPYAVVRHPMYAGALLLVTGIPMALGSVVGLSCLLPFVAILVWRLLDEERFLVNHLPGYRGYREKVRYRLVPLVW